MFVLTIVSSVYLYCLIFNTKIVKEGYQQIYKETDQEAEKILEEFEIITEQDCIKYD